MLQTSAELTDRHLLLFAKHAPSGDADECWSWRGTVDRYGYGYLRAVNNGVLKGYGAHRVAYILSGRTIADGMVIDHLCRNRLCVNPAHLEPVTNAENRRRSIGYNFKSHCHMGHELSGDNEVWRIARGIRYCRACNILKSDVWNRKKRAQKAEA